MKCQVCNSDNSEKSLFCVKCGSPLWVECPHCNNKRQYGLQFCPNCGKKTQEQIEKEKEYEQKKEKITKGCLSIIVTVIFTIVILILAPFMAAIGLDYRAVGASLGKYLDKKL